MSNQKSNRKSTCLQLSVSIDKAVQKKPVINSDNMVLMRQSKTKK